MGIQAHVVGSLGRNAEVKNINGNDLTSFSIASNSGYGDKKVTTWIDCTIFGNRGVKLANYLTKGQQVVVHGELTLNEYTGKDGTKKASLRISINEIDLVGGKNDNNKSDESPSYESQEPTKGFDDDIPF